MSRSGGAELTRVNSYQWPSGHVGHLSDSQQAALQSFKELCHEKGYWEPGNGEKLASHDDETLLRYLRARKFVPQDAFGQFKDTEDWRKENQLDTLYETIDIHEYEQTRRLYPQWTGRRDRRGIPIYVFEVANLDYKDVSAYEKDSDRKKVAQSKDGKIDIKSKVPRKMLRLFALYENLCRFVLPLCSAMPDRESSETPISQSGNIVDISKVGLKQFWNLRAHLQDSSALATAYYPETLDRIFVIGAPSFFPTIWEWAKRWFDPITVSKICIINDKNMLAELSKFIHPDNIPKKYGGNLDWQFGQMPYLDNDMVDTLKWQQDVRDKGHRTLPIGPIKWEYDEGGNLNAIAIGTENNQPRKSVLAGLQLQAGLGLSLSPGTSRTTIPHQTATSAAASEPGVEIQASAKQEDQQLANGTAHDMSTSNVNPQTTEESALAVGKEPLSDTPSNTGIAPQAEVAEVSHQDSEEVRQGTSHTRLTQQVGTHAEGTLEDGTPHVRTDGQGTQHAIMEPRTVGQALKETSLKKEEGEQSGIVDTAKEYAGQAQAVITSGASAVMSAVGAGGENKDEVKQPVKKSEDSRIDQLDESAVEEFIRDKSKSQPENVR